MKAVALALLVAILWPTVAHAQGAPIRYDARVPSKLLGCYAPVASNLIGSNESDHSRRGSPTFAYDWSAAVGTPVFSICPGTVRRTSSANEGGYGWNVVIDHSGGYSTLYAHCLENSFRVKAGDKVTAWTQICSIGRTGMTSWPHVHLNIDYNGVHQPVGKFFDSSLIHYCHFTKCQATNRPNDPIRDYVAAGQPSATIAAQTRYAQLLRILAQYPPQVVSLAIMALLGLLVLIYWLGGRVERIAIVGGVSGMAGAALIVWLMVPLGTVQAGQQPAMIGGDSWKVAYAFMRKWEGNSCTRDPIRTFRGVTNSSYNAWRQSKGMGPADVCSSMTDDQMQAIYYERYWLASGANRLPAALAVTHFDMAVNAGTGVAKGILAQCGSDVRCYNSARERFYRSARGCAAYCAGWLNRLNSVRKLTER